MRFYDKYVDSNRRLDKFTLLNLDSDMEMYRCRAKSCQQSATVAIPYNGVYCMKHGIDEIMKGFEGGAAI